jgi:hypothetical protein
MAATFTWWGGSAVAMIAYGLLAGLVATEHLLGIVTDSRRWQSLTYPRLSPWTIMSLPPVARVFEEPQIAGQSEGYSGRA